jgi:cell division protein FtsB
MAFLPMALQIGGAIFSGVSAMGQANYKAKVAERNAQIAERNAHLAAQQAQVDSLRQDREMASLEGSQLATQGASGLDVLGASQLATRATTRRARNEGALDIRRQGEAQSATAFNQQAGYLGDAGAARSAGKSAMIGSIFEAAGAAVDGGMFGDSLIGKAKSRRNKFA